MDEFERLAGGFQPASEQDWQSLAAKGDKDRLSRLRSRSMDGIPVGPLYVPHRGPILAMRPAAAPWRVLRRVVAEDGATGRTSQIPLEEDPCGVQFLFIPISAADCRTPDSEARAAAALSEIASTLSGADLPLWIDAGSATPRFVRLAASHGRVNAVYDPLAALAAATGATDPTADFAAIGEMIRSGREGLSVTADGRPWHNGGATEVQELGIVLASAVAALRFLGDETIHPETAWQRLGIWLAADADQFLTIAKFRAARLLLARLAEVAGLDGSPPIQGETSWRMLGAREPTMNLVRATTAAFAAAVGGADAIAVLPPMLEDEDLSARMARNVQLILLEEAALARSADPGAGSGAVEDLTARLAADAWALFTRIEAEGGLPAAIRSGSIVGAVAHARDARLEAVARRRLPMVGVNVNVDPDAPLPVLDPADTRTDVPADAGRLRPVRLAEPFERLAVRLAEAMGGEPAVVFRAGKGGDPDLADALAALGIRARFLASVDALETPPRLACIIVGEGGEAQAAETAARLRAAGARVLVAALAGSEITPGWCDAIITPDADLNAIMAGLLDRIADRQEKGQG